MSKALHSKTVGERIITNWDDSDFLGRLQIIKENRDLFKTLGLVTNSELDLVDKMPNSDIEYILNREEQPIFTSLNIKNLVEDQSHYDKFITALTAVFY